MVREFYLDGKSSRDFGILINSAKPFGAPKLDVNQIAVPGRDGDVFISNERYENFELKYTCGIINNIDEKMRKIKSWLYSKKGYRVLYDDYTGKDYFRLVCFNSDISPDIDRKIATFDIAFSCNPYLFSFEGQKWLKVNSKTTLFNPEAFESRPILKIHTDMSLANTDIYINKTHFHFDDTAYDDTIIVDTQTQNAYFDNNGTYENANNIINTADIKLKTGINTFTVGSGLSVEIMPRWRTL